MNYYLSDDLWKTCQAVIFSFITAPAVTLLLVLFCTVHTGSPSKAFLDQARSLVSDTTSNTVMVCSEDKTAFFPFGSPQCQRHSVNADDAIDKWDSQLLRAYLVVAGITFICWMLCELISYRRKPWRYGSRPSDMTLSSIKLVPKESDDDTDK